MIMHCITAMSDCTPKGRRRAKDGQEDEPGRGGRIRRVRSLVTKQVVGLTDSGHRQVSPVDNSGHQCQNEMTSPDLLPPFNHQTRPIQTGRPYIASLCLLDAQSPSRPDELAPASSPLLPLPASPSRASAFAHTDS